jgi:hypothetical protein
MAEVFVPLNRFQSVIASLTGEEDEIYVTPEGISTIILSAQITNNTEDTQTITILVNSNRNLAVPNFDGVNVTGSFVTASALLELNKRFIQQETFAFLTFQNNLLETPIPFNRSFYETNLLRDLNSIIFDISNNSTLRTKKSADGYYDKNGKSLIPVGQVSASLNAINYANELAQQVILNNQVTQSVNVSRLYQNTVTQSFNTELVTEEGSGFLIQQLYTVIRENIQNPIRVPQPPAELVKNVPIPKFDAASPIVAGRLVLEEGYSFIISGSEGIPIILSILESANE